MEGIKPKPLQRAIGKLLGQAVEEIEADEQMRQYEQLAKMQAQAQKDQWTQQQLYNTTTWTTTTTGNTLGQATTGTTWPNPQLGGGLNGPYSSGTYQTVRPASIVFTDEQMATLMKKLAHALAKGWECTRCHRIWSPREVGCEFCNFIDRLEGKDVDRDTAA